MCFQMSQIQGHLGDHWIEPSLVQFNAIQNIDIPSLTSEHCNLSIWIIGDFFLTGRASSSHSVFNLCPIKDLYLVWIFHLDLL